MIIEDIERLEFDSLWQIENIDIPCLAPNLADVTFGSDEVWFNNNWARTPPTKKQLETMGYVVKRPKTFLRKYKEKIIDNCDKTLEATDYGFDLLINTKIFKTTID